MSLNSIIISALNPIAPVSLHEYTGTSTTYITFFCYHQGVGIEADDEEVRTKYNIQIDIFTKGNVDVLAKKVKEALKVHGFKRTYEMDMYETETKTYRRLMQLNVMMETEADE